MSKGSTRARTIPLLARVAPRVVTARVVTGAPREVAREKTTLVTAGVRRAVAGVLRPGAKPSPAKTQRVVKDLVQKVVKRTAYAAMPKAQQFQSVVQPLPAPVSVMAATAATEANAVPVSAPGTSALHTAGRAATPAAAGTVAAPSTAPVYTSTMFPDWEEEAEAVVKAAGAVKAGDEGSKQPTLWQKLWPVDKPFYARPAVWIGAAVLAGGLWWWGTQPEE